MATRRYFLLLGFALGVLSTLAGAQQARAALGETADSVSSDRVALAAKRNATTNQNGFTVQEFETNGTSVREYISPSGIVFAIAWNGMTHPDLTQLLGSYADEYKTALRQTPRKLGIVRRNAVQTDGVVVEKWGHMRNLQGRAYAPALIPPGVTIEHIR